MNKEKRTYNHYQSQIDTLTDPGVYQYSIQIRSNATGDGTVWMNITKEQLQKIREIFNVK